MARYGPGIGEQEMAGHPVVEFAPGGGIVLLLEAGVTVAGGAGCCGTGGGAPQRPFWRGGRYSTTA